MGSLLTRVALLLVTGAACAVAPGSSTAQTTNTNCYGVYPSMNCTSTTGVTIQPPMYAPPISPAEMMQAGLRLRALREQREQQEQAAQAAAQDQAERTAVGRMIASGRCDAAKEYALNLGNLPLASEVSQLCAAPAGDQAGARSNDAAGR